MSLALVTDELFIRSLSLSHEQRTISDVAVGAIPSGCTFAEVAESVHCAYTTILADTCWHRDTRMSS
jgi:hypothetical protein